MYPGKAKTPEFDISGSANFILSPRDGRVSEPPGAVPTIDTPEKFDAATDTKITAEI
jgi:hypothetical protein